MFACWPEVQKQIPELKAAAITDAPSARLLGELYDRIGDRDQSEYYWRQAAKLGDADARTYVILYLDNRSDPRPHWQR